MRENRRAVIGKHAALFCFVCLHVLGTSRSLAQANPNGLYLDFHALKKWSLPELESAEGISYAAGVGYRFDQRFALGLKFYGGFEKIPDQSASPPTAIEFDHSGAGIEGRIYVLERGWLRPYGTLGYDIYTLLGSEVYNGHGFHGALGLQAALTTHLALSLQTTYVRTWYKEREAQTNEHPPFTDERFGVALGLIFFPSILP